MNPCTEIDEECVGDGEMTGIDIDNDESDEDGKTQTLKLSFTMGTDKVELNLTKNDHVTGTFPVFIATGDGGLKAWDEHASKPNFTMYTDMDNRASISITDPGENDDDAKKTIRGTFVRDNTTYMIQPAQQMANFVVENITTSSEMVYRVSEVPVPATDIIGDAQNNPDAVYDDKMAEIGLMADITGFRNYGIETLLVVDYGVYDRYYKLSRGRYHRDRKNDAIYYLNHHFAHVMNGVDLRYRSIRDSLVAFHIRLTGLIIADSREGSPWSDRHREHHRVKDYVNAYNTLTGFQTWIEKNQASLPAFDQATAVTGYGMYLGGSGVRHLTLGLAYYDGICFKRGVALTTEIGEQSTALIIAHEMGHNLGARHDGSGNNCRKDSQYVMASSPGELTGYNFKNVFRFSPCSIYEFRRFITSLNMRDKNCMLSHSRTNILGNRGYLHKPVGVLFTPDEQCQRIYGKQSYYCAGALNDAKICLTMVCFKPEDNRCVPYTYIRAGTGTPCGNRKWCSMNQCKYDSRAPSGDDYCLYGDHKGKIDRYSITCERLVQQKPWLCYEDEVKDTCCKSCGLIQNKTNPDCPYGDRDWCGREKSTGCYRESTRRKCCKTCPSLRTQLPGCEYGDRSTDCAHIQRPTCYQRHLQCCARCNALETQIRDCKYGDRVEYCSSLRDLDCNNPTTKYRCCYTCANRREEPTLPPSTGNRDCPSGDRAGWCRNIRSHDCYVSKDTCCATCSSRRRSQPGCEYGDRAEWCARIKPRDCYRSYYTSMCCDYCRRSRTGPRGCEFGDRDSNCVRERCQEESVRRRCCRTCSGYTTRNNANNPSRPAACSRDRANWCRTIRASDCYVNSATCCRTCASYYRQNQPDCEYGDHYTWCPRMTGERCYSADILLKCCQTCQRFKTNNHDCMFGDRRRDCSRLDCSRSDVSRECCQTCSRQNRKTDDRTCVDSAHWCRGLYRGRCYNSSERRTCCATCARHRTGPFGCEYGDKFTWCNRDACRKQRNNCCATCR